MTFLKGIILVFIQRHMRIRQHEAVLDDKLLYIEFCLGLKKNTHVPLIIKGAVIYAVIQIYLGFGHIFSIYCGVELNKAVIIAIPPLDKYVIKN